MLVFGILYLYTMMLYSSTSNINFVKVLSLLNFCHFVVLSLVIANSVSGDWYILLTIILPFLLWFWLSKKEHKTLNPQLIRSIIYKLFILILLSMIIYYNCFPFRFLLLAFMYEILHLLQPLETFLLGTLFSDTSLISSVVPIRGRTFSSAGDYAHLAEFYRYINSLTRVEGYKHFNIPAFNARFYNLAQSNPALQQ